MAENILAAEMNEWRSIQAMPSIVFTIPKLAQVGKSEEQLKQAGVDFESKEVDMTEWLSNKASEEPTALANVLIDKKNRHHFWSALSLERGRSMDQCFFNGNSARYHGRSIEVSAIPVSHCSRRYGKCIISLEKRSTRRCAAFRFDLDKEDRNLLI